MINTKKPKLKETVGALYVCFNTMSTEDEWTTAFDPEVEKTNNVKSITVSENSETKPVYASGKIYDTVSNTSATSIELETIAFVKDTLAKMRGDNITASGLNTTGRNITKPFFALGKVVKYNGAIKYVWYPKCKLTTNDDEVNTKEDSYSEQSEKCTITAYSFNDEGDIDTWVDSEMDNFPEGLTEDAFFSQPILNESDLAAVINPGGE